MAKKSFDTRVKAERKRLLDVFSGVEEQKLSVVIGLIDRAAFMRCTLEDLEAEIKENGETELFSQGKEEPYYRETPCSKKYDTRSAIYLKIIAKLREELPKQEQGAGGDAFDEF